MDTTPEPASYGHAEILARLAADTIAAMGPADYLAALGRTADEVAATLAALGMTGSQIVADYCPVARYLHDHAKLGWAAVSCASIAGDRFATFDTPGPVADFVRAFDRGAYPELIAHGGHWDSTP